MGKSCLDTATGIRDALAPVPLSAGSGNAMGPPFARRPTIGVLLLRWLKSEGARAQASWRSGDWDRTRTGRPRRESCPVISNSVRNADEHWASSLSRNAPGCASA